MPIPFFSVPEQIQISIVQKLEVYDFVDFQRSSRKAHALSTKVRTRFAVETSELYYDENWYYRRSQSGKLYFQLAKSVYNVMTAIDTDIVVKLPVRIVAGTLEVLQDLTPEICEWLINFYLLTNSSSNDLSADSISCHPEQLNRFIETAKIEYLIVLDAVSPALLKFPAIETLEYLNVESPFTEEDLASLKVASMYQSMTHISCRGINSMIKEWITGARKIFGIEIETTHSLDRVFDGIPHTIQTLEDDGLAYLVKNTKNLLILIGLSVKAYADQQNNVVQIRRYWGETAE